MRVSMADTTLNGRLNTALTDIATQYNDTLEPARRLIETHALSSITNPQLPVPAAVLDARNGTCEVLDRWYWTVRAARKLKIGIERWDVPNLTAFLLIHATWLADSQDGAKATRQLEHCATQLTQIATDSAPRRFRVGPCPGTTNDQPCPGTVQATMRNDADMLPSELACNATPSHVWPAGEWRVLRRRLQSSPATALRLTVTRSTTLDLAAARALLAAIRPSP